MIMRVKHTPKFHFISSKRGHSVKTSDAGTLKKTLKQTIVDHASSQPIQFILKTFVPLPLLLLSGEYVDSSQEKVDEGFQEVAS